MFNYISVSFESTGRKNKPIHTTSVILKSWAFIFLWSGIFYSVHRNYIRTLTSFQHYFFAVQQNSNIDLFVTFCMLVGLLFSVGIKQGVNKYWVPSHHGHYILCSCCFIQYLVRCNSKAIQMSTTNRVYKILCIT